MFSLTSSRRARKADLMSNLSTAHAEAHRIIRDPNTVSVLVAAAERGAPPLAEVADLIASALGPALTDAVRSFVGTSIAGVLELHGFEPGGRVVLPTRPGGFVRAAIYRRVGPTPSPGDSAAALEGIDLESAGRLLKAMIAGLGSGHRLQLIALLRAA